MKCQQLKTWFRKSNGPDFRFVPIMKTACTQCSLQVLAGFLIDIKR